MTPPLPQAEITRIEADAKNYGEKSHDLYSTTLNASQISYFAGAKAEAVRGREQIVGFMEWLGRNYRESTRYKSIDGGKLYNLRKGTLEATWKDHRIEELIDTYILDTQKAKQ